MLRSKKVSKVCWTKLIGTLVQLSIWEVYELAINIFYFDSNYSHLTIYYCLIIPFIFLCQHTLFLLDSSRRPAHVCYRTLWIIFLGSQEEMGKIYFQTAFQKLGIQGVQSVWPCNVSRMMFSIPEGNKREQVRFRCWQEPGRKKGCQEPGVDFVTS